MGNVDKKPNLSNPRLGKIFSMALLVFIIGGFFYFNNAKVFYLTYEQQQFIQNLENGLLNNNNNSVKIENIYPDKSWDIVCAVPAHAYIKFSENASNEVKKYFGEHYNYNWLTTPDPLSMFYGLGFSFLKNGKLQKFILIPAGKISFFKNGHIIVKEPTKISIKNADQPFLYFTDLNVNSLGGPCHARATAFIKYHSQQNISIGD